MIKKLIDTNIFIDRFLNPNLHKNIFLSEGLVYLSSIVLMELRAGEIVSNLQSVKGYDIKKSASITNDCLIAASARSIGATLYTQNRKDFQAIKDVFDFKVSFV